MKTIKMKKADWEKWDAALRSGEYYQTAEHLWNGDRGYCCLGVLQHCLTGETEDNSDQLPSRAWLAAHDIVFDNSVETGNDWTTATTAGRAPTLVLGNKKLAASDANDQMDEDQCEYNNDDELVTVVHRYPFPAIADAIKEAVEFIDA